MPVEIRELLVRTTLEKKDDGKEKQGSATPKSETPSPAADASSSSSASGSAAATPKPAPGKTDTRMQERLLKECVNIIMDNLSSLSKER